MKASIIIAAVLLTGLAMACACQGQPTNSTGELTTTAQPPSATGAELSWPRQFADSGIQVSIFQPQIEKCKEVTSKRARL